MIFKKFDLRMFGANTNVTTDSGLSDEMKVYYSDYLIDSAEPELVHDQFGQRHPIPANGGKTIEFRKFSPLAKALTPLTEGVVPDGQKLSVSTITAEVHQYGGYISLSDVLLLTAIDNNLVQATKMLGGQAGRTSDTITREVLMTGTNVVFSNQKEARCKLVGGEASGNCYLTVDDVKRAVRVLKKENAPKYDGYYWGIIHPDCEYDIMNDSAWLYPHQYKDTKNIYVNELGEVAGVRFVESTEAKVFHADDLASDSRELAINKAAGYTGAITTVDVDGGTLTTDCLKGRTILLNGVTAKITANTTTSLTFASTDFGTITDDMVIYPGEAGAKGRDVYATLVGGANAYGITEVTGGGLKHFVKPLGSAGSSDPIDQIATVGWKLIKAAEILVNVYMVRIESCSTFNDIGSN